MARLTCSVQVVQLRTESRLWMEKLEDQLMSVSGELQRGMRHSVNVRIGPFALMDTKGRNRTFAATASEFRCRSEIGRSLRSSGATQIERELMDATFCGNVISASF
jgi:hypothetical protein